MTVIEGRSTVVTELGVARGDVRKHVAIAVAKLLEMPAFHNALPGLLSDPEREPTVNSRLYQLALLNDA